MCTDELKYCTVEAEICLVSKRLYILYGYGSFITLIRSFVFFFATYYTLYVAKDLFPSHFSLSIICIDNQCQNYLIKKSTVLTNYD